ncbi:unnamed protein product [Knipowitschia caucasica]
MLQQILKDMYIDPEVLEALNEDQKKTLFLKMRQEQVRRWQEREDKLESEGGESTKQTKPKKANSKSVSWLLGRDGDVAVIVIGEVDELSSRFICSGVEKRSPPSLQNNSHNRSILITTRMVACNRIETDATSSTPGLSSNKNTSTLPPLSVSVNEHSSPPAAQKLEFKPAVQPEEKSRLDTSVCPRPLVRTKAMTRAAAATAAPGLSQSVSPGAPGPKSLSPTSSVTEPAQAPQAQPAPEKKSQETQICKEVAPSCRTVRSASEDALSDTPSCAGRGRVAQLMKAFSTENPAGIPKSSGQTPTRGTKPPLPTKPCHLRPAATPSVR